MPTRTLVETLFAAGFPIGPPPQDPCRHCGHRWGNHLLWADNTGDPLDGGHVSCPHAECVQADATSVCRSNWGLTDEQRALAKRQRDEAP